MGDRHQFRAKWHDYECGIYFVTVCTDSHRHYFGKIGSDGNMHLSAIGKIMERHVKELSLHFNFVEV